MKVIDSIKTIAESDNGLIDIISIWRILGLSTSKTSRRLACAIVPVCYGRATGSTRVELRNQFGQFSNDDQLMVRQEVASQLGRLAPLLELDLLGRELIPILERLSKDEKKSVRLLVVEACVQIGDVLGEEQIQWIQTTVIQCAQDPNRNVRKMVAEKIIDLQRVVGSDMMVNVQKTLLEDSEPLVRATAICQNRIFIKNIEESRREMAVLLLVPCVEKLFRDPSDHVQLAFKAAVFGTSVTQYIQSLHRTTAPPLPRRSKTFGFFMLKCMLFYKQCRPFMFLHPF